MQRGRAVHEYQVYTAQGVDCCFDGCGGGSVTSESTVLHIESAECEVK